MKMMESLLVKMMEQMKKVEIVEEASVKVTLMMLM